MLVFHATGRLVRVYLAWGNEVGEGRFVDLNWAVCYGSPMVCYWCTDAERTNGF